MKILLTSLILTLLFSLTLQSRAEIIFYEFEDPVKEERFNKLINVLRCPKCQNNNLADSNAPLSVDLKDIIYEKIHAGYSDEEIIDFLKERYGDFIHYKPPVNATTWLLWFGPFVLLLVSATFVLRYTRMAKAQQVAASTATNDTNLDTVKAWQSELEATDSADTKLQDDDK